MTRRVDLNADMGESFGPWTMGDDGALMEIITSANIACGFHAGDPDVMARTMRDAIAAGVSMGAHPGFADLKGFGRHRLPLPEQEIRNLLIYQIGAAQAMARACGGALRHVKMHGALSNMASEDRGLAEACFGTIHEIAPELTIVGLAGTVMEDAARAIGCRWAGEIFADRAYNPDATLVDRRLPGAMVRDAGIAGERIVAMLRAGAILPEEGAPIPTRIDTICVHGDTPEALALCRSVRAAVEAAGFEVGAPEGAPL